jgi:hypothetical protein
MDEFFFETEAHQALAEPMVAHVARSEPVRLSIVLPAPRRTPEPPPRRLTPIALVVRWVLPAVLAPPTLI